MTTLLRRIGFYVVAAFAAITVNFFLPRMLPGSALQAILTKTMQTGATLSPSAVKALEAQYGVSHASLFSQYLTYLGNTLSGNLGTSPTQSASVSSLLGKTLPWTIGLVGSATVIAFLLGTFLGVIAGWKRNGLMDFLLPVATFFQAVPYFVLGMLLLVVGGVELKWFPLAGGYTIGSRTGALVPGWNWPFISSVLQHGVLPAATVVLASIAGWIMGMRNMMITTMDEDYVLVAAAKGLPRSKVVWVAARNAILPSISNFALSISLVVTGSIVTEIIFSYPGVGYQIYQAITSSDYPLMQGLLLVVTFTVLGANLLADIAYVILDPRARREA